jgi:hypothetical protein
MIVLQAVAIYLIRFAIETLVLWGCSFTVKTPNANLKTAAIYNAIISVVFTFCFGIAVAYLLAQSNAVSLLFLLSCLAMLCFSFWLLMRLYIIRFWSAAWLTFATWFVHVTISELVKLIS